ncbi:MAG: hypothetical protein ACMUIE_07630 [Thermoplasmatota archaeon]
MDWKEFYSRERRLRHIEIFEEVRSRLKENDPEADAMLNQGGLLSFPHTFLDHSMVPVVRTVCAVKRKRGETIVGLGPLHFVNIGSYDDEFCLDLLEHVVNVSNEIDPEVHLDLKKVVLPINYAEEKTIEETLERCRKETEVVRDMMIDGSIMALTGDLVHYGHGYGMVIDVADVEQQYMEWVREQLDLAYVKKDHYALRDKAFKVLNDQTRPMIVASTILGEHLEYKIFSHCLSDYSLILDTEAPTYVASIFYGVHPV